MDADFPNCGPTGVPELVGEHTAEQGGKVAAGRENVT